MYPYIIPYKMDQKCFSKAYSEFLIGVIRLVFGEGLLFLSCNRTYRLS